MELIRAACAGSEKYLSRLWPPLVTRLVSGEHAASRHTPAPAAAVTRATPIGPTPAATPPASGIREGDSASAEPFRDGLKKELSCSFFSAESSALTLSSASRFFAAAFM